jgi:hypothetical protein
LQLQQSDTETKLFRVCTAVAVGNGEKAKFWHSRWLNGQSPTEIAPELIKFAWRKNLTVKQALTDRRWMRGLQRITPTSEVQQFVKLWNMVHHVQLTEQPDEVRRFTANERYSSKSAYII